MHEDISVFLMRLQRAQAALKQSMDRVVQIIHLNISGCTVYVDVYINEIRHTMHSYTAKSKSDIHSRYELLI